jgi:membrane-associated phospholipid phosphatase
MPLRRLAYYALWAAPTAAILYCITKVESWGPACLVLIALSLIGISRDAKATPWPIFLPAGCLTLALFYFLYRHAAPFWTHVVAWQTSSAHHRFHWNGLFSAIPGNDAAWLRIWQPPWLTSYMKAIYSSGFALSYWVCVIRAFFTKDVGKFARYSLAGYLLQVPLILPFYNTVLLQEVWFVQGAPDMLGRGWPPEQQGALAANCFPSMHTSIAFAALLLVRRERSVLFRAIMTLFCCSIIASTLYLKIHWLIDVVAGIAFAYGCVVLADRIVDGKAFGKIATTWERLGSVLYNSLGAGAANGERDKQPEPR